MLLLHSGKDTFKGQKFHSAVWNPEVNKVEGKKVAVIGTGASAVQIVPAIKDLVEEVTVFQRTAAWVPVRYGGAYPEWVKVALFTGMLFGLACII